MIPGTPRSITASKDQKNQDRRKRGITSHWNIVSCGVSIVFIATLTIETSRGSASEISDNNWTCLIYFMYYNTRWSHVRDDVVFTTVKKRCRMSVIRPNQAVRKLFAGLTEQTFIEKLGVADPKLTDYLSTLLSRFLHMEISLSTKKRQRRTHR